jgi:hypothetical protein
VKVPSGSVLVLVKVQLDPVQLVVKAAVGGVLGPTLLPPPQAEASAAMTIVALIRGVDRIESSQPKE